MVIVIIRRIIKVMEALLFCISLSQKDLIVDKKKREEHSSFSLVVFGFVVF